jgi:hypothetical protein
VNSNIFIDYTVGLPLNGKVNKFKSTFKPIRLVNFHINPSSKSSYLNVFWARDLIDIFYLAILSTFLYSASITCFFALNFYSNYLSKLSTILSFSSIFNDILLYEFKSSSKIYRGFSFYFIYFCNMFASSFSAWAFVPFITLIFYVAIVIVFLLFFLYSFMIVNFTVLSNYSRSSGIVKFIWNNDELDRMPVLRTTKFPLCTSTNGFN